MDLTNRQVADEIEAKANAMTSKIEANQLRFVALAVGVGAIRIAKKRAYDLPAPGTWDDLPESFFRLLDRHGIGLPK